MTSANVTNATGQQVRISLDDMSRINPLISPNGSAFRVGSVLTALAGLFTAEPMHEPDSASGEGIAAILESCAAALRIMEEAR